MTAQRTHRRQSPSPSTASPPSRLACRASTPAARSPASTPRRPAGASHRRRHAPRPRRRPTAARRERRPVRHLARQRRAAWHCDDAGLHKLGAGVRSTSAASARATPSMPRSRRCARRRRRRRLGQRRRRPARVRRADGADRPARRSRRRRAPLRDARRRRLRDQPLPGAGRGMPSRRHASVAAPECLWADALTKIVIASGDARHPLLARFGGARLAALMRRARPTPHRTCAHVGPPPRRPGSVRALSRPALLASGAPGSRFTTAAAAMPCPRRSKPWLMRLHGLAAFAALFVFGALAAAHIPHGWRFSHRVRRARQRSSGLVLCLLAGAGADRLPAVLLRARQDPARRSAGCTAASARR